MSKPTITAAVLLQALLAATDPAAFKQLAEDAIKYAAEQETIADEASKYNEELQKQLEAAQAGVISKPTIKIDDAEYTAEHAVRVDGVVYQPKEIVENLDIARRLLNSNSTALAKKPEIED